MEAVRATLCALSVFGALFPGRSAVLASFSQSLDSDFTFTLPAGRKECFFQTMKKDASLEIEYQVSVTYSSQAPPRWRVVAVSMVTCGLPLPC